MNKSRRLARQISKMLMKRKVQKYFDTIVQTAIWVTKYFLPHVFKYFPVVATAGSETFLNEVI